MSVKTFEGFVENGRIRLRGEPSLPEHTRVFVVVLDAEDGLPVRVPTPRLVYPEQAADFQKEVAEAGPDADV